MARGFILLAAAVLLTNVSCFGQIIPGIGYPGGGYPGGGYPGQQRYPQGQGGPQPGRGQTTNNRPAPTTLVGILRKVGDNNTVIIESDDQAITTLSIASSTKYVSASGGSAKIGDFQPGDHVSIAAKQDSSNVYHATTMTMVSEGTPEEHSIASVAADDPTRPLPGKSTGSSAASSSSASTSTSNDDDHPRLRRASSNSSDTTSSSASNSSSNPDDGDHPRMRRPASSSSDTPSAQITPGDSSDPGPPQLRRASPPADPDSTVADARPSLHADDVNGATRMPSPPQVGAPSEGTSSGNQRTPQRLPSTGDPFIDDARQAAFSFSETLPNYVVKQFTTRYATSAALGGKTSWQALDTVTADVIEENGNEKYKNILVNGKPPLQDVEKTGSWTRGEFSSVLQDVLSPLTNADFHGKRAATIVNRAAFRYDFSVEQPNSHWHVEAESQEYQPAYSGSIWIDKDNYRVLRIEMSAQNMPRGFPLDTVESAVDYDYVVISDNKYLLPVHSEALSCARGTSTCTRNVIEFRNYKKFSADTSITFDNN